jgi:hypothetical protein
MEMNPSNKEHIPIKCAPDILRLLKSIESCNTTSKSTTNQGIEYVNSVSYECVRKGDLKVNLCSLMKCIDSDTK